MYYWKNIVLNLCSIRIIRFFISGGMATCTYYIVAMAGYYMQDIPIGIINSLAYLLGFFVSYFLQKYWTFKDSNSHKKTIPLFIFVSGTGFAINSLVVFLGMHYNVRYYISSLVATITTTVTSYIMQKKLVFNQDKK